MVTRAQAASKMANLQPFKGTLNASGDPESEEGYTVSSYNTPIARVTRQPDTGHYQVSHSEQRFSPTTTNHQRIARMNLPGVPGPPIGEQRWSSVGAHGEGAVAMRRRQSPGGGDTSYQSPQRHIPYRGAGGSQGYSGDMGHGMLISELLPELFNDRREHPVNRRPTR